jgi:hypothetical protein
MKKFFNSGLYEPPFFTKHRIALDKITSNINDLSYDFDLLSNYYRERIEDEDNEDRIKEIIEERLFEALSYWPVYFEPLAFNKQVALECDLIPFIFGDIKLLSLGGCGMNLSPKLDAYQVLVCGMIDKRSTYFHKREKAYFEYVVGKDLYQRIGQILAKSAL